MEMVLVNWLPTKQPTHTIYITYGFICYIQYVVFAALYIYNIYIGRVCVQ